MRYIVPVKDCDKCGHKMENCSTNELDCWGISKCSNPKCDNWKDVTDIIKDGGVVRVK